MKPSTFTRSLFALLFTSFMIVSGSKCPAQKTIIDPNTLPRKQVIDDPFELDKRLNQKVSYSAKNKAVRDILADLENMSEIKFYAGYNRKDWQVRDRRMNIFVKDVSLRDLMRSISRVMKFKWSVSSDKELQTYRLIMDRRYLLEVQKLLKEQEEAYRQYMAERRQDVISGYVDADKLSQENLAQIKESDPQLYYDVISGLAAPLARFMREVPQVKTTLLDGGKSVLLASDLPQSARESLKNLIEGYHAKWQMNVKIGSDSSDYSAYATPSNLEDIIDHLKIDVQTNDKAEYDPDMSLYLGTIIAITNEEDKYWMSDFQYCMAIPIFDNDAEVQRKMASAEIKAVEENQSVWNFIDSDTLLNAWTSLRCEYPGEPTPERADDLSLDAKVKVITDKKHLLDIEQALAECTDYSVIADSFYSRESIESLPKEEKTLREVMDWIETKYQYNWEKHGNIVELRDKQWFRKRSLQLPDEWLDKWRKELVDTGTMTIKGLSELAGLSWDQYKANIRNDEILKCVDSRFIDNNRYVLMAYSALTPSERSQAFLDAGLNLHTITEEQKMHVLRPMNAWFKNDRSPYTGDGKTIFLKSNKKGNVFEYEFTAIADDTNLEPVNIKFTTPEYKKPEKSENKQ